MDERTDTPRKGRQHRDAKGKSRTPSVSAGGAMTEHGQAHTISDVVAAAGDGPLVVVLVGMDHHEKRSATDLIAGGHSADISSVDLSLVVSKYIGETEKNLERAFAEASEKGWILFFDEADALFGKRTDVKDAHDQYANMEVSYLTGLATKHSVSAILALTDPPASPSHRTDTQPHNLLVINPAS